MKAHTEFQTHIIPCISNFPVNNYHWWNKIATGIIFTFWYAGRLQFFIENNYGVVIIFHICRKFHVLYKISCRRIGHLYGIRIVYNLSSFYHLYCISSHFKLLVIIDDISHFSTTRIMCKIIISKYSVVSWHLTATLTFL